MVDTVSIIDLVDKDREAIIDQVINQRLASLFYASPQKQLEYLDKAIGVEFRGVDMEKVDRNQGT